MVPLFEPHEYNLDYGGRAQSKALYHVPIHWKKWKATNATTKFVVGAVEGHLEIHHGQLKNKYDRIICMDLNKKNTTQKFELRFFLRFGSSESEEVRFDLRKISYQFDQYFLSIGSLLHGQHQIVQSRLQKPNDPKLHPKHACGLVVLIEWIFQAWN